MIHSGLSHSDIGPCATAALSSPSPGTMTTNRQRIDLANNDIDYETQFLTESFYQLLGSVPT